MTSHHSEDATTFYHEDKIRRDELYAEQRRVAVKNTAEEAARKALMNDPEHIKKQAAIIAENASRRQIYDSIDCRDCKKKALLFDDIA